jgi:hypothetical protein
MERMLESERNELWDRYEAGESQRSISRHLGRSPLTVRTQLVSAGWRRPTPPLEWCSLRLSLSSVRRSQEDWPVTSRCVLLLVGWRGHPQQCLVRSRSMVATSGIGPTRSIGHREGEQSVPRQ